MHVPLRTRRRSSRTLNGQRTPSSSLDFSVLELFHVSGSQEQDTAWAPLWAHVALCYLTTKLSYRTSKFSRRKLESLLPKALLIDKVILTLLHVAGQKRWRFDTLKEK